MNIEKYLNTIKDLNLLIENVSSDDIDDIQKSIESTKVRMDILDAKIQNRLMQQQNMDSLPFTKILIDFKSSVKLSVRSAVKKTEYEFNGRHNFDVLSVSDEYMILRKDEWDYRLGIYLYYSTLQRRSNQRGEIQLFYNEYGEVYTGEKTRSGLREEVIFEVIETK